MYRKALFENIFDEMLYGYQLNDIPYNTFENENEYVAEIMLPGIKKENIKLNVENDQLIIEAKRVVDNSKNYYTKKIDEWSVNKTFKLPNDSNKDKISAITEDGILKITIPKGNVTLKKMIEIKGG